MAILANLSGRCAALRGPGMRSYCVVCPGASQIRFGLHTPAIISRKSGTHCAAEMPYQRAPNRTGTVAHELCAPPLRTVIAHELCAEPLRIFSLHYHPYPIVVRPMRKSSPGPHRRGDTVLHQTGGPVLHQRGGSAQTGGPVLHQRGAKWRERPPPPFAHFVRH